MENRFNDLTTKARLARVLAPAFAVSLGLGLFAQRNALVFSQQASQGRRAELSRPAQTVSPMELSRAFINVAKQVKPAVVHINMFAGGASQAGAGRSPYGQMEPPGARRGSGSGVIVSADGYFLANKHVAGYGDEVRVKLYDSRDIRGRSVG